MRRARHSALTSTAHQPALFAVSPLASSGLACARSVCGLRVRANGCLVGSHRRSGLHNTAHFLGRMFPPNFARWDLLVKGLQESLEIAVLASALAFWCRCRSDCAHRAI